MSTWQIQKKAKQTATQYLIDRAKNYKKGGR